MPGQLATRLRTGRWSKMASVSSHPPCQGQELCRQVGARVPTDQGEFQLQLYRDGQGKEHLAFVLGEVREQSGVLVRLHSECFTGDVLGSLRCDCGPQLKKSLEMLSQAVADQAVITGGPARLSLDRLRQARWEDNVLWARLR